MDRPRRRSRPPSRAIPRSNCIQAGRDGADLTDPMALEAFIHQSRAHVVINAGAYNFVDKAESEEATRLR
jgi:dTDP-4-dehydrorhamnose reductase